MKLSAPIYHLKRRARLLSRNAAIPLHRALDRVAVEEGFARWALRSDHLASAAPARQLLARLDPGDLPLLAARPGHGKTQLALELVIAAIRSGRRGIFFTLEYTPLDILDLVQCVGEDANEFRDHFEVDTADSINADYIMRRLSSAPAGTLVVVDYLQLLDQRRTNPELQAQVAALQRFARARELLLVFLSQIDRSFDAALGRFPDLDDVRLPNALDLALFDKACFLHNGELQVTTTGDNRAPGR